MEVDVERIDVLVVLPVAFLVIEEMGHHDDEVPDVEVQEHEINDVMVDVDKLQLILEEVVDDDIAVHELMHIVPELHYRRVGTDEIDELDIVVIYHEKYNIMLIEVEVEHEIVDEQVEFDTADDEAEVTELWDVCKILIDARLPHVEVEVDEHDDFVVVVLQGLFHEMEVMVYLY